MSAPEYKKRKASLSSSVINRILGARSNRAFPYKTYGRVVVPRGTTTGLATFGASARSATAAQRAARARTGYIGRGAYLGKYFGGMGGAALATKTGRITFYE